MECSALVPFIRCHPYPLHLIFPLVYYVYIMMHNNIIDGATGVGALLQHRQMMNLSVLSGSAVTWKQRSMDEIIINADEVCIYV